MKKVVVVLLCGLLAQGASAASDEFPYAWLNVQTNNFGWHWSSEEGLVGYVIDDRSRSNLPSSMRIYQGEMIFEFDGAPGVFKFEFEIRDSNYHYDEHVSVRAFTGDAEVPCEIHDWGELLKGVRIEFPDEGVHKIVIHGGYHRIYSQNGASRGCVTVFSNFAWHPDFVRVEGNGSFVQMPCSWLEEHVDSMIISGGKVDYSALANSVGKNGYTLVDSFVAGLDPNDEQSQFRVDVSVENGRPIVSWSPQLSAEETAKRVYTVYGKKTLEAGEPWTPVETPAQGGWRFFKVGVEMR